MTATMDGRTEHGIWSDAAGGFVDSELYTSDHAADALARLIALDLPLTGEVSPVSVALMRLATSVAQSFEARKLALALPTPPDVAILSSLGP